MSETTTQISPSKMTEEQFSAWLEMEPEYKEKSEDGDYFHVPIGFLEPDLRATFEGRLKIKIKETIQIFGSVTLHIRIKVFHPVHKIWLKYDGIASVLIENVKAGKYEGSTDVQVVNEIKTSIAVCYSEAIKNAAKKIGKRFGSDLNRINKPGVIKEDKVQVKKKAVNSRIESLIDQCATIAELNAIMPDLPNTEEVQQALNNKLKTLKKQKKS